MQAMRGKRMESRVADLGGFTGMFRVKKKGRVKGTAWLMKTIVSIYADYLVQERHMSRDGEQGHYANFNDFVYSWHLSKFGLKQIAEINLVDLIVTVRKHSISSHKVQVMSQCANSTDKPRG
jgi:hypothetical protein